VGFHGGVKLGIFLGSQRSRWDGHIFPNSFTALATSGYDERQKE
jgi:hypothetical protein